MQTIQVLSQLKNENLIDNQAIENISNIDNDVIGTGLFLNILLSFGAFISTIFVYLFVASIYWTMFGSGTQVLWVGLAFVSLALIGTGYAIYSAHSLFKLRLSSFFLAFGKLTFIGLIIERIGFFVGYEWLNNSAIFISLLALFLAIVNLYISRLKLEVFLLLFACMLVVKFGLSDMATSLFGGNLILIPYIDNEFLINCGLWIWVVLSLLKFNLNYKSRLPFYAFMSAQIILAAFNINLFDFFAAIDLGFILQIAFNFLILAPSIYLILKLQKQYGRAMGWQYYALFGLLVAGGFLPISNLNIILFCFLFGYTLRDGFILATAYILTPIFVYNLYRRLDLTLDTASIIAMIMGLGFLLAYGIVRFSKFKLRRAE